MKDSPANWVIGNSKRDSGGGFDQNIGVAGVVYILSNDGFKDRATTRSGAVADLDTLVHSI